MLALCLMLSVTYYAQIYAGIIGWSLPTEKQYSQWPRLVTGVGIKDIRTISVTLEHKNVTIVARRGTLLRYAEHLQDKQIRKIQPNLEQLRLQNTPTM